MHHHDVPLVPNALISVNRSSINAICRIELWPCDEPKFAMVSGPTGTASAASARSTIAVSLLSGAGLQLRVLIVIASALHDRFSHLFLPIIARRTLSVEFRPPRPMGAHALFPIIEVAWVRGGGVLKAFSGVALITR